MQAIINGEMHEVEPAVKVILDRVMCENAELKRENKRLEEAFQKATGEIAADPLPGECRDIAEMYDDFECSKCGVFLSDLTNIVKEEYEDGFNDDVCYAYEPNFCPECGRKVMRDEGGADNETD